MYEYFRGDVIINTVLIFTGLYKRLAVFVFHRCLLMFECVRGILIRHSGVVEKVVVSVHPSRKSKKKFLVRSERHLGFQRLQLMRFDRAEAASKKTRVVTIAVGRGYRLIGIPCNEAVDDTS